MDNGEDRCIRVPNHLHVNVNVRRHMDYFCSCQLDKSGTQMRSGTQMQKEERYRTISSNLEYFFIPFVLSPTRFADGSHGIRWDNGKPSYSVSFLPQGIAITQKKLYEAKSNFPQQIDNIRLTAQRKKFAIYEYENQFWWYIDFLKWLQSIDHTHCFLFTKIKHLKLTLLRGPCKTPSRTLT